MLLAANFSLRAQDTSRFRAFPDSNNILSNLGVWHTLFSAGGPSTMITRQPRLQANTSAYLGATLTYKWFSFFFAVNIPQTSVLKGGDKEVRASQIALSKWWDQWGVEGSYQHDRGLLEQDHPGKVNSVWQWVDYKYVGVNITWFLTPHRFSYAAADNFSRLQTRSGGSFMAMLTPAYQNFALQKSSLDTVPGDSSLYNLLTRNANHVVLLGKVGYTYAFAWADGHWTCSPLFCIGPGAGVYLDQFHTKEKLYPMLGYQGRLTAGYNGGKWYAYVSGLYDFTSEPQKNLGLKTINESASLSVGYRFHSMKRRILGLL